MATIGLDFGTHQTKICIEDRSDKNNPRYSFFKFRDLKGQEQIALPTVVQVNNDDTLSYGYVDANNCKVCARNNKPRPKQPILKEPVLVLPPKPQMPKLPEKPKQKKLDWKDSLLIMSGKKEKEEDKWKRECDKLKADYERSLQHWISEEDKRKREYVAKLADYRKTMDSYAEELKRWEAENAKTTKMVFRYFKQVVFGDASWDQPIPATTLSILYIANILFDLNKVYGFYRTQMGIPTGYERLKWKKGRAVEILLTAFNIVENVFNNNKEVFLNTKLDELLSIVQEAWQPYSEEKKKEMGIFIFPEAYASLLSITTKNRLEHGINLMVDIGGGTTDISLFVIDVMGNNEPLIYHYTSMDKGINYILERAKANPFLNMEKSLTLDSLEINQSFLANAKNNYHTLLYNLCQDILNRLYEEFRKTGRYRGGLREALHNRPIVYNGGGSTFLGMRRGISSFNQIQHLNDYYWKGMLIEDMDVLAKKNLCPILSVALGLSVQQKSNSDDIRIYDISTIFAKMKLEVKEDLYKYEHGLTDD